MATNDLDETDRQILELLHENGRATYNEIGDALDITGNTIRRRIDEMREKDIIDKFTVLTNPEALDYITVAFGLSAEAGKTEAIAEKLASNESVYKLWILSGTHNIIFDARFESMSHFQSFIHNELHTIEGITRYESSIVTRSVTDEGSIILSDSLSDETVESAISDD